MGPLGLFILCRLDLIKLSQYVFIFLLLGWIPTEHYSSGLCLANSKGLFCYGASNCCTKEVLGETQAPSILLYFLCALVTGMLCSWTKHNLAYLFTLTQALCLKKNRLKNKHLIIGCMRSMAPQVICNCINSILFTWGHLVNLVVELLEYCFCLQVSLLLYEKSEFLTILNCMHTKMADQMMCKLCALHSDKVCSSNQ